MAAPSRIWIKTGMKVMLAKFRNKIKSMIGAISAREILIHYEKFSGSNTVNVFLPFMLSLREKYSHKIE